MTVDFLKFAKRLALVASVSAACASGAFAQSTSTATASATANIVRPIVVTKTTDMAFGNVVADAAAVGTAILDNADGLTFGGAASAPGLQGSTHTSALFSVSGEGSFTYALTLPTVVQTLTNTASADTMDLDTFTSSLTGGTGTLSGSAGAAGTQTFKVGATLHLAIGQAVGAYTGSFDVTVAYN